jgi:hypothetical protein
VRTALCKSILEVFATRGAGAWCVHELTNLLSVHHVSLGLQLASALDSTAARPQTCLLFENITVTCCGPSVCLNCESKY